MKAVDVASERVIFARATEEGEASAPDALETAEFLVEEVEDLKPFTYRWPDAAEAFERGWQGVVRAGARSFELRHALAVRHAYGRDRVRSVTWLDGQVMVEGVAGDDYESSRALLSGIRGPDGRYVRDRAELPPVYKSFKVVVQREELDAPYSRRVLAVKIPEDDLRAWARHALQRLQSRAPVPQAKAADSPPPVLAPAPPHEPCVPGDEKVIVRELLGFGRELEQESPGRPRLTPHPEANELVTTNPFAFLLGVVADQGIVYERAWNLPYLLRERLGHLDPERIVREPESVREAVARRLALHRMVEIVPRWIVEAARMVLTAYGGDASRIWSDSPTAVALQARFDAFPGVGQKKAAMAVEILARDLRVPVRDLHGSDIAYDVHVRRVFLRTGLATRDDPKHMVEVARRLHPERPGVLDYPAWAVGRRWCHPQDPDCPECVLTEVCPKYIGSAALVRGL